MEKSKIIPQVSLAHDIFENRLTINVELPGVDEKNISLDMKGDTFCISAPTNGTEYAGCFPLGHFLESDKAEKRYEGGVLHIAAHYGEHWDRLREGFMGRPVVKG